VDHVHCVPQCGPTLNVQSKSGHVIHLLYNIWFIDRTVHLLRDLKLSLCKLQWSQSVVSSAHQSTDRSRNVRMFSTTPVNSTRKTARLVVETAAASFPLPAASRWKPTTVSYIRAWSLSPPSRTNLTNDESFKCNHQGMQLIHVAWCRLHWRLDTEMTPVLSLCRPMLLPFASSPFTLQRHIPSKTTSADAQVKQSVSTTTGLYRSSVSQDMSPSEEQTL